ncbi:unnamed protein product [Caenorhabditis sp. 36 PRJEB53466]|nr:unnamed protein product [Caenorhabditis sp. 36 PRJEB53466]
MASVLNYSAWGVLQSKVQAHPHLTLDSLKKRLEAERAKLFPEYLRATVDAFPKILKDVVKNKGNRIEQP